MSAVAQIHPRLTHQQEPADLAAAEQAAAAFLTALGVDISREATAETPRRMASAYAEMLAVPSLNLTAFPNDQGYDELVMVEAIPLRSTKQIADELWQRLEPHGVGVVIVAEHACMSQRGARAHGARTVTSALYGGLRDNQALRAEFLALSRAARERS